MPNPSKFKTEKDWMRGCMHQVMHLEKKERDQAVAQCLNMWRDWQKKKKRKMTRKVAAAWIDAGCGHVDDGIPIIESPAMPGVPLEKPTAKAVEALKNENSCSSGWHSGFSPDFNGLEPCWAIVFDRHVSPMAIQCAEKAGLKVNVHQRGGALTLTDIYLPGVSKEEQDKASKFFDSFAEEYSKTNKKTATIIRQYINGDARVISMHNPELVAINKKQTLWMI